MKKTLIALAVLGATGAAYAQSNVTIYGAVDVGYVKESRTSVYMDERFNNRLGFMGQEDLGGGLKATFQLEHRFDLYSGVQKDRGDFEGAANVGLKGSFGHVRFGRVNELSTETYRKIDPFEQYGVGGMIETPLRGGNTEGRLSNTARYDSPNYNGFQFGASYTIKGGDFGNYATMYGDNTGLLGWYPSQMNNGYAVSATYTNGPMYLVANYNKAVNSQNSFNWNVGGAYAFGPLKLSLGYEATSLKDSGDTEKMKTWIVGASYKIGAGTIRAAYNSMKIEDNAWTIDSMSAKKYSLGYLHDLSKRTAVYADFAKEEEGTSYRGTVGTPGGPSTNKFMVGITHKF